MGIQYKSETIIENDLSKYDEVIIFDLADIHLGNEAFDKSLFESDLKFIKETSNVFVILGGDLIENNTKNTVGSVFQQLLSPREQKRMIVDYLKPIKHKILGSVQGNHEARIDNKSSDTDIAEDIAGILGVPYNPFAVLNYISVGFNEKINRPYRYSILTRHGSSGGTTISGAVNGSLKARNILLGVDIFMSGHTHQQSVIDTQDRIWYSQSKSVREINSKFITTGAYLSYSRGGYAVAHGMVGKKCGALGVVLSGLKKNIMVVDIPSAKLLVHR